MFKFGHYLDIGQKSHYENHRKDLPKRQRLQQIRLGLSTITESITSFTYRIQDNRSPSVIKTVHRLYLVEYYPIEESLPAMIEQCVPDDQQCDEIFERYVEQRIGKLNSFIEPVTGDFILFPITASPTAPTFTSHKRDSLTSSDSGVGSPQVFSPTLLITPQCL